MSQRISIHITSKDRLSEILLVLQSLRTQKNQAWDLIILDDSSGNPYAQSFLFQSIIQRLKLEGHRVKHLRSNMSGGVCFARQLIIDNDEYKENPLILRLDDDIMIEPSYIEKLIEVIDQGYDIATGVVPQIQGPDFKREPRFLKGMVNKMVVDDEGNIVQFSDDCGLLYLPYDLTENGEKNLIKTPAQVILPAHGFRTNALYKRIIHEKVNYEKGLSVVGFREETFFSIRAIMAGFKIGCNVTAVAYHFRTPSGGCRNPNYPFLVQQDDHLFKLWLKYQIRQYGNFLAEYERSVHGKKE